MVQCVQARVKNSQTVSVQPTYNFYPPTDTACKGPVARTVVGSAAGQYALTGCNVTGAAIPTTVSCPACSPSNQIACYYTNGVRRRWRVGGSAAALVVVVTTGVMGLTSWISW